MKYVDLFPKITFGEMRASGVHSILIYCRDHRCSHHVETNADRWADDVRLSDVEPSLTCTRCGKRSAERPVGVWPGGADGRQLMALARGSLKQRRNVDR